MRNRICFIIFSLMMVVTFLTACDNNKEEHDAILKPISKHIIGKWEQVMSEVLIDDEWEEDPMPEGMRLIIEFRPNGTSPAIMVDKNGFIAMTVGSWTADDPTLSIVMGEEYAIESLNTDKLCYITSSAYNYDGTLMEGESFRWVNRRMNDNEEIPGERLLGKWAFSKSYKKEGDKWVETTFAIPDEGWHEYLETGKVNFYSRTGTNEMTSESWWRYNETTDEMRWVSLDGSNRTSVQVIPDEDYNSMEILYEQNMDYLTGEIIQGEFKDVMVRVKK